MLVPEGKAGRSMVPEAGALIADSIFLASIAPIRRPASTSSPSSTSVAAPAIGAAKCPAF